MLSATAVDAGQFSSIREELDWLLAQQPMLLKIGVLAPRLIEAAELLSWAALKLEVNHLEVEQQAEVLSRSLVDVLWSLGDETNPRANALRHRHHQRHRPRPERSTNPHRTLARRHPIKDPASRNRRLDLPTMRRRIRLDAGLRSRANEGDGSKQGAKVKLISKTKRGKTTTYTVQMSGKEFNFLRMCFNAVINSAGTANIVNATPYSESTINVIDDQLRKIADTEPSER